MVQSARYKARNRIRRSHRCCAHHCWRTKRPSCKVFFRSTARKWSHVPCGRRLYRTHSRSQSVIRQTFPCDNNTRCSIRSIRFGYIAASETLYFSRSATAARSIELIERKRVSGKETERERALHFRQYFSGARSSITRFAGV